MNWTCEQTEARLSDYLDGLLQPAEQAAFDFHVNACERCTPLVAGVLHVLGTLQSLAHRVYAHSAKFVSNLRVVYEIQTRLNENEQNPATREQTVPKNSPDKQPGRTDNTNPSAPKQQNRADEIGRNLRVLASQFPVLSGSIGERRMP